MQIKISKHRNQLVLTAIFSSIFLFFWINGPINQAVELGGSTKITSEFGEPKIVGRNRLTEKFSLIIGDEDNRDRHGNGLLLQQNKKKYTSKVLVSSSSIERSNLDEEFKHRAVDKLGVPKEEISFLGYYALANNQIYFESSPRLDYIMGYAGPINLGMVTNLDNEIEGVWIISSDETESYVRTLHKRSFFYQFIDLPFSNGAAKIDGVSGATITATTIGKITEGMVHELTSEQTSYASMGDSVFEIFVDNSLLWILHCVVILLIFYYGYQTKRKKSKRDMLLLSIFSLIYIGFFLNNSFTYVSFLEPFLGTSISTFTGIYAFAAITGSIWGNNVYCKYVCPFGHAQRLIIKLPFGKQRKLPITNRWVDRIRNLLTVTLIIGILLGVRHWKNFEVFPSLFGYEVFSVGFGIAAVIILISLVYPMFWCRVACPTGCVLDNLNKLSSTKLHEIKVKTKQPAI